MGITLLQNPLSITPAFNDVAFVVSSTDTASAGFQFMGTVKNGAGTTLANLTAKVYLDSGTKGVFNLKRILESYVGYDFDLTDSIGNMATTNSVFDYELELGQQGGSPIVQHPNLLSFTGTIFNGALERKSFETYASGDFAVKSSNPTAQFLTEQRKFIRPNQNDWLYWLAYPTAGYTTNIVKYKSYNAAGSLLKTVDVLSAISGTGTWQVNRTPIGRNTANIPIGDLDVGSTLPVVHADATYFTVELRNGTGPATISEVFRIDIDNDCTQFDLYNIYYLNKQGGFDSFAFDLKNFDRETIERKQFKRNNYELVSNVYSYNNKKAAVVNYDTRYQRKLTLNSNWITDDQAEDLAVLISSPVIFMQKHGLSYFVPINIENVEWEKSKDINEALRLCKLDVIIADNNRRQSG